MDRMMERMTQRVFPFVLLGILMIMSSATR